MLYHIFERIRIIYEIFKTISNYNISQLYWGAFVLFTSISNTCYHLRLVDYAGAVNLKDCTTGCRKETAEFLIDIMPVMFIPAGVGLIVYWPQLKEFLIPICVIIVVSSILVMFVTGKTSDLLIRNNKKGDANHE